MRISAGLHFLSVGYSEDLSAIISETSSNAHITTDNLHACTHTHTHTHTHSKQKYLIVELRMMAAAHTELHEHTYSNIHVEVPSSY